MSRTIRTTIPEDAAEAMDRICARKGLSIAAWLRIVVLCEIGRRETLEPGAEVLLRIYLADEEMRSMTDEEAIERLRSHGMSDHFIARYTTERIGSRTERRGDGA